MYYCGIDVAKHKHAVAVLDEHGHAHKAVFSTENTRQGMETLLSELKPLGDICIGLEATGHYWLSLYDVLTKTGSCISRIRNIILQCVRDFLTRTASGSDLCSGVCGFQFG
jgi:transposase